MSETLSLNDKVGVRLKPKGREMIAAAFGGVFPTWMDEKTDDDGYTWMQWHELANLLGPELRMGFDTPCETTVRLAPTETVEQEKQWCVCPGDRCTGVAPTSQCRWREARKRLCDETVEHGEDDVDSPQPEQEEVNNGHDAGAQDDRRRGAGGESTQGSAGGGDDNGGPGRLRVGQDENGGRRDRGRHREVLGGLTEHEDDDIVERLEAIADAMPSTMHEDQRAIEVAIARLRRSAPREVVEMADQHCDCWGNEDESYWLMRLMQEVGELASSLAGDHEDPPGHELAQIASIAINWLRRFHPVGPPIGDEE